MVNLPTNFDVSMTILSSYRPHGSDRSCNLVTLTFDLGGHAVAGEAGLCAPPIHEV